MITIRHTKIKEVKKKKVQASTLRILTRLQRFRLVYFLVNLKDIFLNDYIVHCKNLEQHNLHPKVLKLSFEYHQDLLQGECQQKNNIALV